MVWEKIHYFQTLDSTNSRAYQLALNGVGKERWSSLNPRKKEGEVGKAVVLSSFFESLSIGHPPAKPFTPSSLSHHPDGSRCDGRCHSEVFRSASLDQMAQ